MAMESAVTPMSVLSTGGQDGMGMGGGGLIWGLLLGALVGNRRGGLFGGGDDDCGRDRHNLQTNEFLVSNSFNNLTDQIGQLGQSVQAGNRDQLLGFANTTNTVQSTAAILAGLVNGAEKSSAQQAFALSAQICNTESNLGTALNAGFATTQAAITQSLIEQLECCCEIKEAIASSTFANALAFKDVQLQAATNTCNIIQAVHDDGEETRELINAQERRSLENEIAELRAAVKHNDQENRLNNLAIQVGTIGSVISQIPTLIGKVS